LRQALEHRPATRFEKGLEKILPYGLHFGIITKWLLVVKSSFPGGSVAAPPADVNSLLAGAGIRDQPLDSKV
jgi:hypothetical protein